MVTVLPQFLPAADHLWTIGTFLSDGSAQTFGALFRLSAATGEINLISDLSLNGGGALPEATNTTLSWTVA